MEENSTTSGFLSGSIGGAFSMVTTYPLDTVKVRLQLFSNYKGVVDCAQKMVKQEGVRSFFRGMTFPLISASMYNSLVFGSYQLFIKGICQWRYDDVNARASLSDMFLASMATGASSVVIGSPVDLIKIQLQMQTDPMKTHFKKGSKSSSTAANSTPHPRYSGPINCTLSIYRQSGITGLYRGASTMLIRDIPGYAIYLVPYFTFYEYLTNEKFGDSMLWKLFASAVAGGCAGVISWGGIHPLDTIKTRFQADNQSENKKYHSFWQCTKSIYKEDGLKAFFRGISINALRGFPQSASLYLAIEMTNQLFGKLPSKNR